MLISELIEELERIKSKEGDIQVTCTACLDPDSDMGGVDGKPFESTVENLVVGSHPKIGKRVRFYL